MVLIICSLILLCIVLSGHFTVKSIELLKLLYTLARLCTKKKQRISREKNFLVIRGNYRHACTIIGKIQWHWEHGTPSWRSKAKKYKCTETRVPFFNVWGGRELIQEFTHLPMPTHVASQNKSRTKPLKAFVHWQRLVLLEGNLTTSVTAVPCPTFPPKRSPYKNGAESTNLQQTFNQCKMIQYSCCQPM